MLFVGFPKLFGWQIWLMVSWWTGWYSCVLVCSFIQHKCHFFSSVTTAWRVQPRNYLLFACHFTNTTAQLVQEGRFINYWHMGGRERKLKVVEKPVVEKPSAPSPAWFLNSLALWSVSYDRVFHPDPGYSGQVSISYSFLVSLKVHISHTQ